MAEPGSHIGMVLHETYRLERLVGRGGMGVVYEASHLRLPRRFAVKLLSVDSSEDPEAVERFRHEAFVTSQIGHPNIVEVVDFHHTDQGEPYLVMELLVGEDLGGRLRRSGPLSVDQTAEILEQVACKRSGCPLQDSGALEAGGGTQFIGRSSSRRDAGWAPTRTATSRMYS